MSATYEIEPEIVAKPAAPKMAKLPPAVCVQMAAAFPLAPDAQTLHRFEPPGDGTGTYAHSIVGDGRRQALIMAGPHPYDLAADSLRLIAGTALRGTVFADRSISATGGVFAILNGGVETDPDAILRHQDRCQFGRAFELVARKF
jgi:hypothetical protein